MQERVLLVDDEPEFLEIMAERMRARDMDVSTSTSAAEALSMIASESFDAVIMDFMMPEMDGIEALKAIKDQRPDMQIILLTGHASVETSIEGMKLGAFDYLLKPMKFEELLEKLASAFKKKAVQDKKIRDAKIQELVRYPGRVLDQVKHNDKS